MAAPHIKTEPRIKAESEYKLEPIVSPTADDDELYEDAGDLDLSGGNKPIWLVKLPSFIAERWRDISEDEEIVLGVVKLKPGQDSESTKNLKLVLEKNDYNGLDTPTDYDLKITNLEVTNTYVFTEKDMPGYESKAEPNENEPIPSRLLYQQSRENNRDKNADTSKRDWKTQRHTPYIRKAIPKRTALVGTARHEISMIPVYNQEYRAYSQRRTAMQEAPKHKTKTMDENSVSQNLLAPGTTGNPSGATFSNFVKPLKEVRKSTDPKAHRMSENDLMTALFQCFSGHEYWSMKGLREKLHQPEAYLKQVLDEIGVMNKSGSFSGKWSLKPEYKGFLNGGSG
ncbi:transcription initiation factor IIF, beta subunit [Geopyxis carbonaria]|nr:transcription initiation factor IIF, beta subunit [Geopyxis carbonaria]